MSHEAQDPRPNLHLGQPHDVEQSEQELHEIRPYLHLGHGHCCWGDVSSPSHVKWATEDKAELLLGATTIGGGTARGEKADTMDIRDAKMVTRKVLMLFLLFTMMMVLIRINR
mmetsp:Transcript_21812/g.33145  ORF Transcript_21812/g.33145 Transcript_21812/m.33145 type:complete len:113 (+) Transcript_21812:242-580(+)